MTHHLLSSHKVFQDGCDRATGLKHIFDYITKNAPAALNCDDILRSAVVLSISSFDLFLHDVFICEITYRFKQKINVDSLRVPFNALIEDSQLQITIIEEHVRKENSYKSFVAPDKLAELLRVLVENPWEKIADNLGEPLPSLKQNLKAIVELRNRIAHQADVNPAYGGVELWPIYADDVARSIKFLRRLGGAVLAVVGA